MIPICKMKSKCDITNYRPFSMTAILSRAFERLFCRRIDSFLTVRSLIKANQHGFRKRKSTVTQYLTCNEQWAKANDMGCVVSVVYLDLAKALDTVCHSKLIFVLDEIGIRGKVLNWLVSYWYDRT